MPATRKSTRPPGGRQATLSFNNRVTKNVPRSGKDGIKKLVPSVKPEPKIEHHVEDTTSIGESQPGEVDALVVPDKSELEIKATILDDRAIQEYWKELESQRKAKRVHQDSLPMSEKILRYFDVSSQYGPCVGLSRLKRWQRAERLGLKPPIEVLAVLLKDDTRKDEASQQAHMDYILNLTAVGSS